MKKLLWVGDAGCQSGFARATHEILDTLRYTWDVTVLGMNYGGDPHTYSYPIYAAFPGGDGGGIGRLAWMCDAVKPDLIVLQNDGWNLQPYLRQLKLSEDHADIPVVAVVAVDGQNFDANWLKGISLAIFWTEFALKEARFAGYEGPAVVIPLGVDAVFFSPMDKAEARKLRGLPDTLKDAFIVGNVNRNQPRKRWDLTIKYFAEWTRQYAPKDAFLFLHAAPTGDKACHPRNLAKHYGILDHLIMSEPQVFYGNSEEEMRQTYNCFDVQVSTTQGEGFGLTTFEGMACGVPQIVPDWSALGELAKGAAVFVPCTSTAIGPPYVNVIGGIPDEHEFVNSLQLLYADRVARATIASLGFDRAHEDRFKWSNIGDAWTTALSLVDTAKPAPSASLHLASSRGV